MSTPPPGAPLPVMIVDDDPGALSSLRFLLESEGYEVRAFASGPELLASLPAGEVTCLIIDFKMPEMDGLAVFRCLRDRQMDAPVIVVTGHPDPGIADRVTAAGLRLIEKPLSQDMLLNAVRAVRAGGTFEADR
ncbi:response regulator transcription factor [Aquabacter spiritensis]|uniref:Response regulator receiver domain-containing protein n=1 Tax=Aquabacter spiritensis TaxID=933073 RepID=A0A4R3LZP3_9HYPH|nr:response regulator [Aquabacter spiritensis]TCT06190.1 response regulator receiver domain-containing protein [Aquabacter spiritensis]